MNRDLRIVSEKIKPYYTLTLATGEELHMLQPSVEMYFRILEIKRMEINAESAGKSFQDGIDLILDYLNSNIEGKKFKRTDILKQFTVSHIQVILGDMWNYSMGIDNEKNS